MLESLEADQHLFICCCMPEDHSHAPFQVSIVGDRCHASGCSTELDTDGEQQLSYCIESWPMTTACCLPASAHCVAPFS